MDQSEDCSQPHPTLLPGPPCYDEIMCYLHRKAAAAFTMVQWAIFARISDFTKCQPYSHPWVWNLIL